MKKSKLNANYEYDFGLIGISSTLKPHKIAWLFNQSFQVRFVRKEDLLVINKNKETILYSQYLYETQLTTLRLFRNKAVEPETSKWMLVPEHAHCDYVLMFKSDDEELGNRLLKTIRDIPSIEWVAFLPLAALKSKDNFIF